MEAQDVQPGQQVQECRTGRSMLVRWVAGDSARCAWFDGRHWHEATLPADRVQPQGEAGPRAEGRR